MLSGVRLRPRAYQPRAALMASQAGCRGFEPRVPLHSIFIHPLRALPMCQWTWGGGYPALTCPRPDTPRISGRGPAHLRSLSVDASVWEPQRPLRPPMEGVPAEYIVPDRGTCTSEATLTPREEPLNKCGPARICARMTGAEEIAAKELRREFFHIATGTYMTGALPGQRVPGEWAAGLARRGAGIMNIIYVIGHWRHMRVRAHRRRPPPPPASLLPSRGAL